MTVLADAGAVYALVDRDDAWHKRVRAWWELNREPIRLPVTILPEVAWLLGTRLGPSAEAAFARALTEGEFDVEPLDERQDLSRIADLTAAYLDSPVGFVDASVLAMAERLGVLTLLTTDRRHFGVLQPRHTSTLRLVP